MSTCRLWAEEHSIFSVTANLRTTENIVNYFRNSIQIISYRFRTKMTASVTRIIIIMTAAKAVTPIIKELSDLGSGSSGISEIKKEASCLKKIFFKR